jgi:RimJ/RimL family protein N-acetyltransferase
VQTLETARLVIRRLEPADAAFVLELVNEPAWMEFIGNKGIHTLEAAESYVRSGPMVMYDTRGFGLCAVDRKDDRRPIGICGLIKRETLADVDLGFAFLRRFWGHGYAYEAAAATLAHAHDVLGYSRVVAITVAANQRSRQLLGRLGFRFERTIRPEPAGAEVELHAALRADQARNGRSAAA